MSDRDEHETEIVIVPEVVAAPARRFAERHPRAHAAWTHARPFARVALFGAAFAGGALLFSRLFGPRVADRLGRQGGEGFARGVAAAEAEIATLERGARFG